MSIVECFLIQCGSLEFHGWSLGILCGPLDLHITGLSIRGGVRVEIPDFNPPPPPRDLSRLTAHGSRPTAHGSRLTAHGL